MTNFIYLSPNFPANHWNFCHHLKNNGINVLGIGDADYSSLTDDLKNSLNEYYKVSSLENYDEVFRAVAYLTYKHGKIDWLESNNEYWLERDAKLRTEFNITTGFHVEDMEKVKFKSKMKDSYRKAGIPVARYHMVDNFDNCKAFIEEVGYPVVAKPDNGVGASDTHKIRCEDDLKNFFETKLDVQYIMEEFITGEVQTYDAIVNSKGEPIFENGNVTLADLMETVSKNGNSALYERSILPEDILEAGRATVKAFKVKSRMVHFEFFRLTKDQYLGKKGDIVALEVNMRPSGGISPTMMNWANGTDVYEIWADMIAYDKTDKECVSKEVCAFASRRDGRSFKLSPEEVREKYASVLKQEGRVEEALSGAMANYMFIANFPTEEEARAFVIDVLTETENQE
ncbi:MAG: ATP-grasp domain-containing protein [Erysipelotrichaceae bacterium]|nr:ATP-grasp domain-containing protein [Erysipelotrichaceae bacterium]